MDGFFPSEEKHFLVECSLSYNNDPSIDNGPTGFVIASIPAIRMDAIKYQAERRVRLCKTNGVPNIHYC
jgi:hypothetical protein